MPLLPAIAARHQLTPDILIIQHESVFDPRLYGLPIERGLLNCYRQSTASVASLNVDIYGGGSWQSEFSLLTGLSSASFGPNAYFIFQKGVGRFHHALPHMLGNLGYRTTLVSSCRSQFLHYDAFYATIGVDERLFLGDKRLPIDADAFEKTSSDALFLDAVGRVYAEHTDRDPSPRFLYALSNANHGPHSTRRAAQGRFEREREFALAAAPTPEYGEYYARLSETATAWRQLKSNLEAARQRRPLLVLHYGDHQPVMTRRIESAGGLPADPRRQFQTFFAIEAINFKLDKPSLRQRLATNLKNRRPVLDISFLGTLALEAAGLPLDRVSATRASLIPDCGSAYFNTPSERKVRFHRTLADLGAIDVARSSAQPPSSSPDSLRHDPLAVRRR